MKACSGNAGRTLLSACGNPGSVCCKPKRRQVWVLTGDQCWRPRWVPPRVLWLWQM
jgi:hypothetical protein